MGSGVLRGKLVTWKDDRGFGFIQPEKGGKEVFLHISELKETTYRPQVGDTIDYHLSVEADKSRALKASIVSTQIGKQNRPAPPKAAPKPAIKDPTKTYLNPDHADSAAAFPLWESLILAAIPLLGMTRFFVHTSNPLPLIIYPVMSWVTFALYADDKSRARSGSWRVPEKTLHLCEFFGGWLGGFFAQRKLRHKNRKQSYQLTFWAIVIFHQMLCLSWLMGWT